jgi:hypothetical protein
MDATSLISEWKRRLKALAENPDFAFRDTPQDLIEQHYQKLTTFVGYTEPEVGNAEAQLGVKFPAVFRQYLLEMAKSPGELFHGSDLAGIAEFDQFRADALELLSQTEPAPTLPPEAVVFMSHQGYTFMYILAVGGFDGPVMQWIERQSRPRQIAGKFAEMVDAELRLMEDTNVQSRAQGGYYLTLHSRGGGMRSYPARSSGERPLDRARKPWWQF